MKKYLDWHSLENELNILTEKIDFEPDLLVSFNDRSSLILSGLIAARIKAENLGVICIKHEKKNTVVEADSLPDVNGKKVLLVISIIENEHSVMLAKNHLEKDGAKVKIACFYLKPDAKNISDFSICPAETVFFPWDHKE